LTGADPIEERLNKAFDQSAGVKYLESVVYQCDGADSVQHGLNLSA
jgi:hypothetical protein